MRHKTYWHSGIASDKVSGVTKFIVLTQKLLLKNFLHFTHYDNSRHDENSDTLFGVFVHTSAMGAIHVVVWGGGGGGEEEALPEENCKARALV